MNEDVEKQMLLGEIVILRVANAKARGLPASLLGSNEDLLSLPVEDLREIADRLKALTRSQGGLH